MPPATIGTNWLMVFKQAPNGKRCPKDEPGGGPEKMGKCQKSKATSR